MKQVKTKKIRLVIVFLVLFVMASAVNYATSNANNKDNTENNSTENNSTEEMNNSEETNTEQKEFCATYVKAEETGNYIYYSIFEKNQDETSLNYELLGFDITLSNKNGADEKTIAFPVAIGNTMEFVKSQAFEYENGVLNTYRISLDDIYKLANLVDEETAEKMLKNPDNYIIITFDAIMTTKEGVTLNGIIEEDSQGGVIKNGTTYHFGDSSDLENFKSLFHEKNFTKYYCVAVDFPKGIFAEFPDGH